MAVRTTPATASDAALITEARLGDARAFDKLSRRHHAAVRDLADLVHPEPARLVAQALATAHRALHRANGPQVWMRGYLLQLAGRLAATAADPPEAKLRGTTLESSVPFRDHLLSDRHGTVVAEFAGLAPAWQAALWHRCAEGEPVGDVGAVVGVAPVMVEPLVTSAREGLRRALLARRWQEAPSPPCRAHLGRLDRSGAVPRSVQRHARVCPGCAGLLADLQAVDEDLPGVLARHLLGDTGDVYLARRRATGRILAQITAGDVL